MNYDHLCQKMLTIDLFCGIIPEYHSRQFFVTVLIIFVIIIRSLTMFTLPLWEA